MKRAKSTFLTYLRYFLEIEPKAIYYGSLSAIMLALKPFILLIISKLLIEAVLSKGDLHLLLRKIFLLLALQFFLSTGGGYFEKHYAYHLKIFLRKHQLRKASHLFAISYSWTEEESMQERLAELQNLEQRNVFSPRSFSSYINKTLGSSVGLLAAIYYVSGLFFTGIHPSFMPEWALDLGFLLLFVSLFSMTLKMVAWINERFGKLIGACSPLIRYIKAYNTLIYQYKSGKDIRLFGEKLAENYTKMYRDFEEKIYSLLSSLLTKNIAIESFMASLSMALVYFFIAIKAITGAIKISEILLFIGAFTQLTHFAMELIDGLSTLHAGKLYREKLFSFYELGMEEKHVLEEPEGSELVFPSCKVENLSFCYPGSEKKILKGLSFGISPGEKIAIVGENGSGKTTLIKLLLGLYREYEGKI